MTQIIDTKHSGAAWKSQKFASFNWTLQAILVRHTFDHLKVEMKSIIIILAFLLYLSTEM